MGPVVQARRAGLLTAAKPLIDRLRDMAGLRIAPDLYERVLQDCGELPV
ncbi:MAG: DUF3368 domain-containing protein [Candidatus Latescibacterota bacterium]